MATKKEDKGVEAVLLRDCTFGKCGELVELAPGDVEQAKLQGMADLHPDAIAAAKK